MSTSLSDMIEIRGDAPRPIYEQIVQHIRGAVAVGVLEAGDGLPSVRSLASSIKVNPNTVARAYQKLKREGLLHTRRGQGTYVNDDQDLTDNTSALATDIAYRALEEASKYGISLQELVEALNKIDSGKV